MVMIFISWVKLFSFVLQVSTFPISKQTYFPQCFLANFLCVSSISIPKCWTKVLLPKITSSQVDSHKQTERGKTMFIITGQVGHKSFAQRRYQCLRSGCQFISVHCCHINIKQSYYDFFFLVQNLNPGLQYENIQKSVL